MARIRSIKPEFFTSTQIAECSPSARLLFIGVWVFADDGGVHPDDPVRLKMEVFPGDHLSREDVVRFIGELVTAGLLCRFTSEGVSYLAVTGWKHQKIDRPTYKYPRPPIGDTSTSPRRALDEPSPPERRGEEKRVEDRTPYSPPLKRSELLPKYAQAFEPLTRWFTYLSKEHPDKLPMDQAQAGFALCQRFGTYLALTNAIDLAVGNHWRSLQPERIDDRTHEAVDLPYKEH